MKKLILGLVFVLLSALFIAFNYLLWDRESREKEMRNLESASISNNATINAQKREISSLENENRGLGNTIKQLENDKNSLVQDKNDVLAEKTKTDTTLQEKIRFINILKQYADMAQLSEPVTRWAAALNEGRYKDAYELEYAGVMEKNRPMSLTVYTNDMESIVKNIEISEVKLDKLRGAANGDIVLAVRLNVELAENADSMYARFKEGINDITVKIEYSYEEKAFIISSMEKM